MTESEKDFLSKIKDKLLFDTIMEDKEDMIEEAVKTC